MKVAYGRPETWSFFFGATLLNGDALTGDCQVVVEWDVTIGVGRSAFTMTQPQVPASVPPAGMVTLAWLMGFGNVPAERGSKWTTTARSPNLDERLPATDNSRPLEWIIGQDIQIGARVYAAGNAGGQQTVEVTAFLAPRSHVRPDWFNGSFPGDQLGGR